MLGVGGFAAGECVRVKATREGERDARRFKTDTRLTASAYELSVEESGEEVCTKERESVCVQ